MRLLRELYPAVSYARNITDIDDKINAAAAEEGVDIKVITDRYRAKYHEDMAALGVAPPDIEPHATEHIDDIIAMISELIARNAAYEAEGHVLFDVTQDAEYGRWRGVHVKTCWPVRGSKLPLTSAMPEILCSGNLKRRSAGWESPWGGASGWHIECSAMIAHHFGPTIDIHGGGVDLQFPIMKTNARKAGAPITPLARYWLHNGMLNMAGEKMSKSRGNIKAGGRIAGRLSGEAVRLALLQGHYRQPLDFTTDLLDQSVRSLDRLYTVLRTHGDIEAAPQEAPDTFMQAVCDDLNTPKAMAELFALAKHADTPDGKGQLLAAAGILGLLQADPGLVCR